MIGELGGNIFLLQTFSEEQRQKMCKIIHYWALDHGYERMPNEYTTPDNFEGSEHASNRTVLYAKDNPRNGERYIISYTEARESIITKDS